ncbi:MAG: hypothetical protein E7427_09535 [Ruminococcaceae bacterium]|nr:hypothetical protein [Oscillospiraceae bacterium]
MKKVWILLVCICLCFGLFGCSNSATKELQEARDALEAKDYETALSLAEGITEKYSGKKGEEEARKLVSEIRVAKCEDAISEIGVVDGALDPYYIIYVQRGYIDRLVWPDTEKYESALDQYNALSDDEKELVENKELLDAQKTNYLEARETQKQLLRVRDIEMLSKELAVESVKSHLKNASSYREISTNSTYTDKDYNEATGNFGTVFVDIKYSATNSYGGRIDESIMIPVTGNYKFYAWADNGYYSKDNNIAIGYIDNGKAEYPLYKLFS